jgi:hypothetical protein
VALSLLAGVEAIAENGGGAGLRLRKAPNSRAAADEVSGKVARSDLAAEHGR